jgi:ABC-type uncharacterized transport system substrate-binding protein
VKAELVVTPENTVTGIRHHWTFDDAFSAYATQGLGKDGQDPSREDLAELAKTNVESLAEYKYFTGINVDSVSLELGAPSDYWLDYAKGALTLNFTLPALTPSPRSKIVVLEVYDPSYFVEFSYSTTGRAVALAGGGQGCAVQMNNPPKLKTDPNKLTEDYFANLNRGSDFASRVIVACP